MGRNLAAKENKGSHPADMHAEKSSATKPIGVTRVNICAALFSYSLPPDAASAAAAEMQFLSPILRLLRYPTVGTSAAPVHGLSSPSRFLFSFAASATIRWWPPALARRCSPLTVSPNPPVSCVFRCVRFLDLMLKFAPLLGCYSLDVDRGNLCFHLFIYPSYVDLPLLCWFLKANGDFFFLSQSHYSRNREHRD